MLKKINLLNKKFFRNDNSGKTQAFYNKNNPNLLNQKTIKELKYFSSIKKESKRICMHSSINQDLHDMIIVDFKNNFLPPHFHKKLSESHHIIEGKLKVLIFNNSGKIVNNYILSKTQNIMDRVEKGQCHLLMAITKTVIYHEVNKGPFNRKKPDMFIPKWFEKLDKLKKINFYKKMYKI